MLFKLFLSLFFFQYTLAAYSNSTNVTTSEIVVTSTYYGTVTELTTYCPASTVIVTNGATYSVTGATTLTITNCPCVEASTATYTETVLCSSGVTFSTLSTSSTPAEGATTTGTVAATTPTPTGAATTGSTTAAVSVAEGQGAALRVSTAFAAGAALVFAYLI